MKTKRHEQQLEYLAQQVIDWMERFNEATSADTIKVIVPTVRSLIADSVDATNRPEEDLDYEDFSTPETRDCLYLLTNKQNDDEDNSDNIRQIIVSSLADEGFGVHNYDLRVCRLKEIQGSVFEVRH